MTKDLRHLAAFAAIGGSLLAATAALTPTRTVAQGTKQVAERLQGRAAFTDWSADRPGLRRHIRPADLPPSDLRASFSRRVRITHRSPSQKPVVPSGFEVSLFAEGLDNPRLIRAAPNGDIFVAESGPGRIRVLRASRAGKPRIGVGPPRRRHGNAGWRALCLG
jgi:glucose/arabinose dehydrogenase